MESFELQLQLVPGGIDLEKKVLGIGTHFLLLSISMRREMFACVLLAALRMQLLAAADRGS